MEALSLDFLSRRFHISKYYLCKKFKEITGFTVIECMNLVRIQEAQRLLKATPLSINDVAERTGFESATHFGRMFKRLTGSSALKFRRQ